MRGNPATETTAPGRGSCTIEGGGWSKRIGKNVRCSFLRLSKGGGKTVQEGGFKDDHQLKKVLSKEIQKHSEIIL